MQLIVQEHREKYLILRALANEVIKCGSDGVIVISKVWSAPYDPSNPYCRAVGAPNKREFLTACLVTKTGDPAQLHAQVEREGDDGHVTGSGANFFRSNLRGMVTQAS